MKKLVIIPAYNESASIEKTVRDIQKKAAGFDYIVVDDCSTDHTARILRQNGFCHLSLPINLGIGGAVQTGYRYAYENGYDIAVQVDGDGQHDASFLPGMARELLRQRANMVIGSRFITKKGFQSSFLRRIGITYFTKLIRLLTGTTITDPTSGLRMVDRDVIRIFAGEYPKDYPEPESAMAVLRRGKKIVEVPVIMRERQGGESSIGAGRSIYYMVKVSLAILVERIRRYR